MATLTLHALPITIPPARVSYNEIRLKYQRQAEAAADHFAANYASTFKNMDDIHNKCTDQLVVLLREAAEIAVQDIVAHGIYDIDLELFGNYMGQHVAWEDDFAVVDDQYMAIVLKAEELDTYRTQRRESRGRWAGGGFGVTGAVKGAMQAGAMNLATGAVHGLFNLTAKGISAVGDSLKKNELYSTPSTKATLVEAVYHAIFNVHFALIDAVNDKQPGKITGTVSVEDRDKAMRLVQNVEAGRLPTDAIRPVLLDERMTLATHQVRDRDFNLMGNLTYPQNYYGRTPVFSPDGMRLYVMAYPSTFGMLPRVFVFDTSTKSLTSTDMPLLGYFELPDYPTCNDNSYGCNTRALGTISPDGKTLFIVGDKNLLVVPVPSTLKATMAALAIQQGKVGSSAAPAEMAPHSVKR